MTKDEALKLALELLAVATYHSPDLQAKRTEVIEQGLKALSSGAMVAQEPFEYWNAVEGWVKIDEVRDHMDSVGCGTIYKTAGEDRVPLCIAQPTPPECQTEAEKIAFAHGWWKALETKAQPPYRAVKTYAGGKPNYVTQPEFCTGAMPPEVEEMRQAAFNLGRWLSAALDDPKVCDEYKADVNAWFNCAMPYPAQPQQEPNLAEAFRIELDKLSQRNYELRMENAQLKAQPSEFALKHRIAELEGAVIGLETQRTWANATTWRGLTIEDKKEYVAQDFGGCRFDAMDWAEKRIKEKNNV